MESETQRTWDADAFDARVERVRRAYRCAAELLLQNGVSPHTKGFALLQYGMILMEQQTPMRRVVLRDTIYPLVEQLTERNGSAEHAIRDAIRLRAQSKTPKDGSLFPTARIPTNAEFLCALSAQMRRQMQETKG